MAAVGLLVVVLTVATLRPWRLPEAVAAVPAAVLAVVLGLLPMSRAVAEIRDLGPTVGFLAAILLLGHLADAEGVFRWLGARLAGASAGNPARLFGLVFVAAAGTTAVLSLDATVVLLTPVVVATATRLRLPARPQAYACVHLSNSASSILPVSNLTNLLAFGASGLSFLGFAALMALPWLATLAVEYLILRRFFADDLRTPAHRATGRPTAEQEAVERTPRLALAVLGLTLAGFGASSLVGVEPVWIAAAGAAVLSLRALARREITPLGLVTATAPLFCLFVLALGVVVAAVSANGLTTALRSILPAGPGEPGLLALLAVAGIAALLANLVNNLPATLVLLDALGPAPNPGLVLALLLGVNIGPNLSYIGSLATLLWRQVLTDRGHPPALRDLLRLGVLTVPLALAASVVALWLSLLAR
ncbi:ArsB/NhaD family transporter [Pseudonocardia acidicola]|uniref:Arsenic transporter n=1 Tax=Pseudonocardia acidicola TaxID=2724939 RepID=A0ABX1S4A1_9PSEU|nr:ArsB/NhaD family transporter [Pseudonocardia acidicola]NMH96400.1 arsenic transporter [Pseudonocardia acidicola]